MSDGKSGLQLRSLLKKNGELEISLVNVPTPEPGPDEVVVRVEATPINPSDLGLLIGPADMEKGNLAKWLKKEGETIKSGDVIAEIETDKATMEVEATDEGTLGKILIPEGTADVAVNTPIATILVDGESAADLAKAPAAPVPQPKAAEAAPAEAKGDAKAEAPQPAAKAPAGPATEPLPDPEIPAGTEMVTQTIREALRDAMAEEMRRDGDVFIMAGSSRATSTRPSPARA